MNAYGEHGEHGGTHLTADDAAGAARPQAAEDLDTPDLYSGGDSVGVGSDSSGAVGSVSVAVFLLR